MALFRRIRPDLRQRAAAALRAGSRRQAGIPAPAVVAAAVEIDALPLDELLRLDEVASLLGQVASAVGCMPCCRGDGPHGRSPAGQHSEWHRAVGGRLQDRIYDRLETMAEAARRDGEADLLDKVTEALRVRA